MNTTHLLSWYCLKETKFIQNFLGFIIIYRWILRLTILRFTIFMQLFIFFIQIMCTPFWWITDMSYPYLSIKKWAQTFYGTPCVLFYLTGSRIIQIQLRMVKDKFLQDKTQTVWRYLLFTLLFKYMNIFIACHF